MEIMIDRERLHTFLTDYGADLGEDCLVELEEIFDDFIYQLEEIQMAVTPKVRAKPFGQAWVYQICPRRGKAWVIGTNDDGEPLEFASKYKAFKAGVVALGELSNAKND